MKVVDAIDRGLDRTAKYPRTALLVGCLAGGVSLTPGIPIVLGVAGILAAAWTAVAAEEGLDTAGLNKVALPLLAIVPALVYTFAGGVTSESIQAAPPLYAAIAMFAVGGIIESLYVGILVVLETASSYYSRVQANTEVRA